MRSREPGFRALNVPRHGLQPSDHAKGRPWRYEGPSSVRLSRSGEVEGGRRTQMTDAGNPFPDVAQGTQMAQSFTGKKRIRKSFGRIPEAVQMPNLIEVQRSSYEQFLQRETRSPDRKDEGI